jgi:hypothetical protein
MFAHWYLTLINAPSGTILVQERGYKNGTARGATILQFVPDADPNFQTTFTVPFLAWIFLILKDPVH